jgi:hypothetical protein
MNQSILWRTCSLPDHFWTDAAAVGVQPIRRGRRRVRDAPRLRRCAPVARSNVLNLELLPARQRDAVASAFGRIIPLRQTLCPMESAVCLTRQRDILAGSRQIVPQQSHLFG